MPAWGKRRQTSRVAQSKTNISTSIQKTGFAIRDWFGPYYTLGCLVAVAIGFCAIIEPSGWLVRAVTGALVLATLITFSLHLVRSRQSAKSNANADADSDADSGPQLHQILFAVTLFFCIGLVISEFLLHGKRPGQSAPQTTSATQTTTSEPAAAPASSATVAAPAVAPAPTVTAAPAAPTAPIAPAVAAIPAAVTAKPEATTTQKAAEKPVTKLAPQPEPQRTAERKEPKERAEQQRAEPQPRRTSAPAAQAGDPQRCSQLIQKFSLGQNLSEADTQYLRSSCH